MWLIPHLSVPSAAGLRAGRILELLVLMGCDPHSRAHSISPVVSSSRAGLPQKAPPPALTHTEGDGAVGMVTTIQDTLSRGPGLQALPRSHRAQKGPQPTVHVVFCLLIKLTSSSDRGWKCRLSRALVSSTRQLRVAKSRHIFGRWILDSPRKSRIQDIRILWFMGLIHTRCHLRQLFWGHEQQWSKGPCSHPGPATCPLCSRFLFWSLGVGRAFTSLSIHELSGLISQSQPVSAAHRTVLWTERM